jgi:hypothetical protein
MMDAFWLLLAVGIEFFSGHLLKQNGRPVLAFFCWLKALVVLSVWIALAGDHSSIRRFVAGAVFVAGVIWIALYFDRHYPGTLRASNRDRT